MEAGISRASGMIKCPGGQSIQASWVIMAA